MPNPKCMQTHDPLNNTLKAATTTPPRPHIISSSSLSARSLSLLRLSEEGSALEANKQTTPPYHTTLSINYSLPIPRPKETSLSMA